MEGNEVIGEVRRVTNMVTKGRKERGKMVFSVERYKSLAVKENMGVTFPV